MEQPRTEERAQNLAVTAPAPSQPQAQTEATQTTPTLSQAQVGQPQVPYQPYYYPAQPYNTARLIPFNKTWHRTKLIATSASIIFCVIILSLSLSTSLSSNYQSFFFSALWSGPFVILTGLWDASELITICARRKTANRGIHPGAHVGVDLCVWLAGVMCVIMQTTAYYDADFHYYSCDENTALLASRYLPIAKTILAFLGMLTLLHFGIFVRACVETNTRNRARGTVINGPVSYAQVPVPVYYPAPAPGVLGGQYQYPVVPQNVYMPAPASQGTPAMIEKTTGAESMLRNIHLAEYYAPSVPFVLSPTTKV
ncbi:uncharacterized protein BCR38DRAFT_447478 [Pseudomassariella vexata]|uniref:Uncharacterized protein n=1 Tax=Pseudomassariella vexata TaxID=1141098 RepID=A0A1Y2DI57_9PEZI|nr:uncharacterized protein BCR38DRAFT_447478 [Pseudomassariella vexata]ORY58495.1 hypothetical protein BCR38DRAFT_447478 [Pseudomassariella vexata]